MFAAKVWIFAPLANIVQMAHVADEMTTQMTDDQRLQTLKDDYRDAPISANQVRTCATAARQR
jgi:hypothetical protein